MLFTNPYLHGENFPLVVAGELPHLEHLAVAALAQHLA